MDQKDSPLLCRTLQRLRIRKQQIQVHRDLSYYTCRTPTTYPESESEDVSEKKMAPFNRLSYCPYLITPGKF